MPRPTSHTKLDGIKKRNLSSSKIQRIRASVVHIKNKIGSTGLIDVLRRAGAQFPKQETLLQKNTRKAASFFEDLLLALDEDITHDVSWNDLLLRASLFASEMSSERQDFRLDVSKLVDDITDYQIGKWEVAAMQGNDFGSEGSNFMHPDLDPEKYVLQEGNCYYGDGTLHMQSGKTTLIYSGRWRDGHLVDGTLSLRQVGQSFDIDGIVIEELPKAVITKRGAFAVRSVHPNAPRVLVAHGPCKDIKSGSFGLWQSGKFKKRFNFILGSDE